MSDKVDPVPRVRKTHGTELEWQRLWEVARQADLAWEAALKAGKSGKPEEKAARAAWRMAEKARLAVYRAWKR